MAISNIPSSEACFTNHLLVAMPNLQDPNFANAVIYLCEHSEQGAMGLVINHPLSIQLSEIFLQFELDPLPNTGKQVLLAGGPVQIERGFVLHPHDGKSWEGTAALSPELNITSSKDIIVDFAHSKGPKKSLIALGYSGWGPGQLEKEIAENSWLTIPADNDILFDTPFDQRATVAVAKLGLDFSLLSGTAGHA